MTGGDVMVGWTFLSVNRWGRFHIKMHIYWFITSFIYHLLDIIIYRDATLPGSPEFRFYHPSRIFSGFPRIFYVMWSKWHDFLSWNDSKNHYLLQVFILVLSCIPDNIQRAMWLPVEIEYYVLPDIFQVNMLTWSHFVNILCIKPNISSQPIEMIKSGPCVMNEIMLANCHISCLHVIHA